MSILLLIVFITLTISAICSLFEAILYSTRTGTLEVAKQKQKNKKAAITLLNMKRDIAVPISAILILNTIANTAGATIAGMYASKVLGSIYVPIFSVLLTLSILFFSEIMPKTIGAVHWRKLWMLIVFPLSIFQFILYPLIYIARKLSYFITKGHPPDIVTEEEILAAARMGAKEGEISDQEHLIIDNLLNLENRKAREIMTPRPVIFSINAKLKITEAFKIATEKGFSRVPIYQNDRENIIGYVMIHDLGAACNLQNVGITLKDIIKPITFIPETINCFTLLFDFLRTRKQIAILIDEYGGLAGLITLEDLLETLLGFEIVDEHDEAIDLQEVARMRKNAHKPKNK
ncbi:MAG: CNNM domain-containing protein [bacterium]|nr:CNNM domain-containing protein [bacterium]